MMMERAVCQPKLAALQRMRIGSGRSPPIRRSAVSIGTPQSTEIDATVSSYFLSLAKSASCVSPSLPALSSSTTMRTAAE